MKSFSHLQLRQSTLNRNKTKISWKNRRQRPDPPFRKMEHAPLPETLITQNPKHQSCHISHPPALSQANRLKLPCPLHGQVPVCLCWELSFLIKVNTVINKTTASFMQEYKLTTSYEILQLVSYDRNNIHQTKSLIKSVLPPTKIQNESFVFF